jgi:hypothetical protein
MAEKICATCHRIIAPPALFCRACAERTAHTVALAAQSAYLPAILDGRLELYLRRRHRHAAGAHIALFGFRHKAYCGEPLATGYPHQSSVRWEDDVRIALCEKCLKALDALILAHQKRVEAAG